MLYLEREICGCYWPMEEVENVNLLRRKERSMHQSGRESKSRDLLSGEEKGRDLPGREEENKDRLSREEKSRDLLSREEEAAVVAFCRKYVVLMEALYRDRELNQWCRGYSAYVQNETHRELSRILYDDFMKEAYELGVMQKILADESCHGYTFHAALDGTKRDLMYGIFFEIRMDYGSNGYLISNAIGNGKLYRLMEALVRTECVAARPDSVTPGGSDVHVQAAVEKHGKGAAQMSACAGSSDARAERLPGGRAYTLASVMEKEKHPDARGIGARSAWHDRSMGQWRLTIQLDEERIWFLSVFLSEDGRLDKFSLDEELASDSHYEFRAEDEIRRKLYVPGDENRSLDEVLIRYAGEHGANALPGVIRPYVTAEFHYD